MNLNKEIKTAYLLYFILIIIILSIGLFLFNNYKNKKNNEGNFSTTFVSKATFSPDSKRLAYLEYNISGTYKGHPSILNFDLVSPVNAGVNIYLTNYKKELIIYSLEKNIIEKRVDINDELLDRDIKDKFGGIEFSSPSLSNIQWRKNLIFYQDTSVYTFRDYFILNTDNLQIYQKDYVHLDIPLYSVSYYASASSSGEHFAFPNYSVDTTSIFINSSIHPVRNNDAKKLFIANKINFRLCLDDFYWNDFNKFIFVFNCKNNQEKQKEFGFQDGIYEMDTKTLNLVKISDLNKDQVISLIKKNIYNPSWSKFQWYQNYNNGAFSGDGKFFAYPEESSFSVNTNYGSDNIPRSKVNILRLDL